MGCAANISPDATVLGTIQNNFKDMFFAEAKVAEFIINDPNRTLESNVSEIAEQSGVSDATVVRFCKKLGFGGVYQMKLQLSHDLGRKHQVINNIPESDSPQDVILKTAQTITSIAYKIDPELIKNCVDVLNRSDVIYVVGSGQSKILAQAILFRLTRLGYRTTGGSFFGTDIENICRGTKQDVLICVSHSGETTKIIQVLEVALSRGMTTIALTDSEKNMLSNNADYSLSTGIGDRFDNIGTKNSFIYMMAVMDCVLSLIAKRQNIGDDLVNTYLAGSRI